jgi:PKD repeat protein
VARRASAIIFGLAFLFTALAVPPGLSPARGLTDADVSIVSPGDGEILYGTVLLTANVVGAADSVEFFYDPHEATDPEVSLGLADFNATSGFWELPWDTRTVSDTYNTIDGVDVHITKPPTHDRLRVVAASGSDTGAAAIDIRIQNMLTVRFTLPDNTEDLTGFVDLEVTTTSEYEVTSVRFDIYSLAQADPRILIPFGETIDGGPDTFVSPIENPHYGRPLGAPDFPSGSPLYEIGVGTPQGAKRWVLRDWDTTSIPDCPPPPGEPLPEGCVDGTFSPGWALVATATDVGGRTATYTVEIYVINDLRVVITAPDEGATVSRFVALEARTSSMTGADNALAGGLWPATEVDFTITGVTDPIPATETPAGSGRWRAVWDTAGLDDGEYTITATATNANPEGAETATYSVDVNLVDPGDDLTAFFPFDWGTCYLFECAFLDGSSGATSWSWDFGDGNTSDEQLPIHTYDDYGVYTVSLTVSDDGGTTTDTYERVIAVGNTGVVGFNINPLDDAETQFINWTSAFKNFDYEVGSTLAIPVMWKTTPGTSATFSSMPELVCDDDELTSNQECVIFTPEEAAGTAPTVVGAVQDGVLFTMAFTEVQFRGITDVFKGKANVRIVVDVDTDGDGKADQTNQLGTNVDVTNSGVEGDEARKVAIIAPFEGEYVGGTYEILAGVVSATTAEQVEFFLGGTSLGADSNGADGWSASWDTTLFPDGPYQLTAVATFAGSETATSAVRNVNIENTLPEEPPAPGGTFQTGRTNDTLNQYITYRFELDEEGGGGPPRGRQPTFETSATAQISNVEVLPGDGTIGGDAIEFDVTMTNNSSDPNAVLTAFAFQSKFSESPALASRIGDKAFYGTLVPDAGHSDGPMVSVKKNGTSSGLFGGRWKGICINSSTDYIPEFNAGLEDESLECGGNRADDDADGLPELQFPVQGLYPGQSQTVRVRIEAGTTDGALHVVQPGTLRGLVQGIEKTGPNGIEYFVPVINNDGYTDEETGITYPAVLDPNVVSMPDFADNKVFRDADGTFNPTFALLDDGYRLDPQVYLTLPRRNFAFTDILGRNHTCGTYGLHLIDGISCSGNADASPEFGFLDSGDLLPGIENFAAILHGFGEYAINPDGTPDLDEDGNYQAPNFPYGVPCVNLATPDGLRCGAKPFTPIVEFYKANADGTSFTQQMLAGSYGALGTPDQYTATFDATADGAIFKEETTPEEDPGGPCDPILDPDNRRPSCAQLRTSATGHFYDLDVQLGAGINGGDVIEFTILIANTSTNPEAYLTAFNYQTKERNLADIGGLDGFSQDRRDIRVDTSLPPCNSLADEQCFNSTLGVGHFPNVVGNGLLFGQMVWQSGRTDRAGQKIIPDFVDVDPVNGIDPDPHKLESVKKNGPFTPILKGNVNFICVKSGLFEPDQDADAACAGDPAELIDPGGEPVPGNVSQRLGLAPGETQRVRMRQEFGDFRGAMIQILAGTLNANNIDAEFTSTQGLARFFDCEDQRELEYCHPHLVGEPIEYLPGSTATWREPLTLEEIEWVIINQPGDAARIMNFAENFGYILAMAGFVPSAEFYAPDPNEDLVGTPYEGVLIRQQVLGTYGMTDVAATDVVITSTPLTTADLGETYTYDVQATAFPGPISYSLLTGPTGMTMDASGLITWTPAAPGIHDVEVRASNASSSATQAFQVSVVQAITTGVLDNFNRGNGALGSSWVGDVNGPAKYAVNANAALVRGGGYARWASTAFGPNQEAYFRFITVSPSAGAQGVLLKFNGPTPSQSANLRTASYIQVTYGGGAVTVATKASGQTSAVTRGTLPASFAAGDVLAAQAFSDGTVAVYRNGVLVGTVNVAGAGSWTSGGGRIGLAFIGTSNANPARIDDFGGGTISP